MVGQLLRRVKIPVFGSNPPRYTGPEYFKIVYRYIVDRVRARGATNILWVLQLNNYSDPFERWNAIGAVLPGGQLRGLARAERVRVDVAGRQEVGDVRGHDGRAVRGNLQALAEQAVMVAEWGVGEFPAKGDKGAPGLPTGFWEMETRFPRLHAAMYWDERWQNGKSMLYSDLRVNSSPGSLEAYRKGVAAPFWLGDGLPLYK